MTAINDPDPEPADEPDAPLSAADRREREDAITSSLVDVFVHNRAARGALEALELRALAAAAALVAEQTSRQPSKVARHAELPERAMIAEFATASRTAERTIRTQMADAADLCARFAATVDALADGRLSRSHVAVIHEAGYPIDDPDARAEFEQVVIVRGAEMTAGRLRPIAQFLAAKANPRSIDDRHAAARAHRTVWVTDLPDGMAELHATGAATLMHGIMDRLTQQAKAIIKARPTAGDAADVPDADTLFDTDPADGVPAADAAIAPDARSMDELRADVLTDLLLTAAPESCMAGDGLAAIRGVVQITVPVLTAAGTAAGTGAGAEPAVLVGHGPVDVDTARRLLGGATGWERVMTSPVTGAVLAVDRYQASSALDRFLKARDERCRFPGCRMPVWRCERDHTTPHSHGGKTCDGNLAHFCKGHHVVKHHTRWSVRQLGGGVLEWTSPIGRIYTDKPEPTLRFTTHPHWATDPDHDPPPF